MRCNIYNFNSRNVMLRKLLNSALASAYSHKDAISFRAIRANVQKLKAMEGELFASRRSFVNFFKRKICEAKSSR